MRTMSGVEILLREITIFILLGVQCNQLFGHITMAAFCSLFAKFKNLPLSFNINLMTRARHLVRPVAIMREKKDIMDQAGVIYM